MKSSTHNPTKSIRFDEATRVRLEKIVANHPPINAAQIITVALNEYLDKAEATGAVSIGQTPNPQYAQDKEALIVAHKKAADATAKQKAKR